MELLHKTIILIHSPHCTTSKKNFPGTCKIIVEKIYKNGFKLTQKNTQHYLKTIYIRLYSPLDEKLTK